MGGSISEILERQNDPGFGNSQPSPNGVLGMLPPGHQAAANAPPPIPGGGSFGDLGGYSQQALQMAGINPQMQPPPPMPGGGMQPPPSMPGGGMPGGKNSPFGGQIMPEQLLGLLSNARK